MKKTESTQDVFLNALRKQRVPVTVFLSNGVKLQGTVTGFDMFSIMLRRGPQLQLVYKHSMATIVPAGPIGLPIEKADADITQTPNQEQDHG